MAVAGESITAGRIRDVAAALFSAKGYHATSMREIAAAVGIRAASVYAHFAAKEDILYEIAAGTMTEMLDGARAACADAATLEEELGRLVAFHVRYSAEQRVRAKVADDELRGLGDVRYERALAIRDEYEGLFRSVLQRGRDTRGWKVSDVPIVTFAIATMASGVDVWYRDDGRLAPGRIAEMYAELALRMVGATGTAPDQDREAITRTVS
jgi:AcrR family transcriptional regulator